MAGAIFIASCASTERAIMLPPMIAGATFVGSGDCALCHNDVTDHFGDASHAHLTMKIMGGREVDIGCESCHGPASLHVESGASWQCRFTTPVAHPKRVSNATRNCAVVSIWRVRTP